jgi:hypothetical protein
MRSTENYEILYCKRKFVLEKIENILVTMKFIDRGDGPG